MDDEVEVVLCPDCGAEFEKDSYCSECGYGQGVGDFVEPAGVQPVFASAVGSRSFPVHEPAWCPHCVAWLGTFPSTEEARAYERSLENHPFEFCAKRVAKLNSSEEWHLRHEAGKRGSIAVAKPGAPRVPPAGASS